MARSYDRLAMLGARPPRGGREGLSTWRSIRVVLVPLAFVLTLGFATAGALGVSAAVTPADQVGALPLPACSDGIDNDGDGLVDSADPDCTSPTGTSEGAAVAATPPPGGTSRGPRKAIWGPAAINGVSEFP